MNNTAMVTCSCMTFFKLLIFSFNGILCKLGFIKEPSSLIDMSACISSNGSYFFIRNGYTDKRACAVIKKCTRTGAIAS